VVTRCGIFSYQSNSHQVRGECDAWKIIIPVVENVEKKCSDGSALGVGKQAEVAVRVTGLRKAVCHAKTEIPAQAAIR
jgi:hypothetical protein